MYSPPRKRVLGPIPSLYFQTTIKQRKLTALKLSRESGFLGMTPAFQSNSAMAINASGIRNAALAAFPSTWVPGPSGKPMGRMPFSSPRVISTLEAATLKGPMRPMELALKEDPVSASVNVTGKIVDIFYQNSVLVHFQPALDREMIDVPLGLGDAHPRPVGDVIHGG